MPALVFVDVALVAIIVASALIGLLRGFVREAMSLAVWLAAVWLAWRYGPWLAPQLSALVDNPVLRVWGARALVLLVTVMGGGILSLLLAQLLRASGLTGTDRAVGTVFGLARGVVLAALAVLALELGGLDGAPWWRQSKLIPYVAPVADALRDAAEKGVGRLQSGPVSVRPPAGGTARRT